MLAQLICIDRRYQRMNCFNIRELQGILKRRFFADLVNTSDFRELLDESMLGLRFRTGNQGTVASNTALFYNYGTSDAHRTKPGIFQPRTITHNSNSCSNLVDNSSVYKLTLLFYTDSFNLPASNITFVNLLNLLSSFGNGFTVNLYAQATQSLSSIFNSLFSIFDINFLASPSTISPTTLREPATGSVVTFTGLNDLLPVMSNVVTDSSQLDISTNFVETSNFRFTRFNNALIQYDYKCGNYVGT